MNKDRILSLCSMEDLVSAMHGQCVAGDHFEFAGVDACQTDSRKVVENELFIALKGEKFDANAFVPDVWLKGCQVAVVSVLPEVIPENRAAILVPDTLYAFGELAKFLLNKRRESGHFKTFGITGSNGKTTTKEMLSALHEAKGCHVLKTFGNFNNWVGLPMTVANLESTHDVAILEMGTNAPGEIRRLVEIAEPDAAIITSVGEAHLLGFGSLEGVARAKGEIMEGQRLREIFLPSGLRRFYAETDHPRLSFHWFGAGETASVGAVHEQFDGLEFELVRGSETWSLRMPLLGKHNADNFGLALEASHDLQLSRAEVADALSHLQLPPGRLEKREVKGLHILFDAYNANPTSMRASLSLLKDITSCEHRFLILGEMGELGAESARLHRDLGSSVAALQPAFLLVIGTDLAQSVVAGALEAGMSSGRVLRVPQEDLESGVKFLGQRVQVGDVILIKGSRSARLERVLPVLEA